MNAIRFLALFSACFLYAFFGSPTPDSFGISELSVGFLLVVSVGIGNGAGTIFCWRNRSLWFSFGQCFLVYGLVVSTLAGVVGGHHWTGVFRDIIPFLFLFLPLFFYPLLSRYPQGFLYIFSGYLVIGVVFSVRSILLQSELCWLGCEAFLYLENMPSVLFAALYFIGAGACLLVLQGERFGKAGKGLLLIAMSVPPLIVMSLTLQRASLGSVVLFVCLIGAFLFYYKPMRVFCLLIIFSGILVLFMNDVLHAGGALVDKTELVGFNNRPQETQAVWDVVSANPITLFFGAGWGAQFNSPAVGGLYVNFTHNFFTSVLLKCGVCGLVLAMLYIAALLGEVMRLFLRNPVLGLACLAPFLIDISLYASFKSLDFGMLLLLIVSGLIYFRQSESYSISKGVHASSDHSVP